MSPIKPAKLADAVAEHIQQLIRDGVLRPGDRLLSERELSARLDVSRPSLRLALDKLLDLGLLTTDAQGVCYISEAIGQSLRDPLALLMEEPNARLDCMEFRSVVEAAAAHYAADRASELDRETITGHFQRMIAAHEAGDAEEVARADADFHFAIYAASHNTVLLHVMRSLEAAVRSNVYLNRRKLFERRRAPDTQLAEHAAIHDAIMDRNAELANKAARDHMTSTMRTQRDIQEAERRQETSLRRLSGHDFIAPPKKRNRPTGS